MGYIKAENVLPDEIIELIQNYIDGEYLYIPRKKGNEKSWGEANGIKKDLNNRNREIYSKYCSGIKVDTLASEYYLSPKTIIKILSNVRQNVKESNI